MACFSRTDQPLKPGMGYRLFFFKWRRLCALTDWEARGPPTGRPPGERFPTFVPVLLPTLVLLAWFFIFPQRCNRRSLTGSSGYSQHRPQRGVTSIFLSTFYRVFIGSIWVSLGFTRFALDFTSGVTDSLSFQNCYGRPVTGSSGYSQKSFSMRCVQFYRVYWGFYEFPLFSRNSKWLQSVLQAFRRLQWNIQWNWLN